MPRIDILPKDLEISGLCEVKGCFHKVNFVLLNNDNDGFALLCNYHLATFQRDFPTARTTPVPVKTLEDIHNITDRR